MSENGCIVCGKDVPVCHDNTDCHDECDARKHIATLTAQRDRLAGLLNKCHYHLCTVGVFDSDKQRLSEAIVAELAKLEKT